MTFLTIVLATTGVFGGGGLPAVSRSSPTKG